MTEDGPSGEEATGATPHLAWAGASVVKAGMRADENEDAWATVARPDGGLVVALADGATERAFSRPWARALVEAAVQTATISAAHARARTQHAALLDARRSALAWYAEAKADEGAFAALLVVRIEPDGAYRAEAVGDACLFEVDAAGRRVAAWPLDTPEAFAARPVLLASNAPPPDALIRTGRIPPAGALLLATDALAAHLLAHRDAVWPPPDLDPVEAIEAARAAGMRNDDTTWMRVLAPSSGVSGRR